MAATSAGGATLALVHEGWNHLMSQRPLAAWGAWQRALRIDPDSPAARQALETLEAAPDLPLAARRIYRFRKCALDAQKGQWDRLLRQGENSELADAVKAFQQVTDEAPDDADAWFNQALCLAWSGEDRQAIDCLEAATRLEADAEPRKAVESWALAEILRQGGGAENLSDDLRFACTFAWHPEDTARLEASVPEIRRIPTPRDPTRSEGQDKDLEVLEWLDRPFPSAPAVRTEADLPRVLATVYITPGSLRMSSPRVDTLEQVEERLRRMLGAGVQPVERVAAPLPLPFLDADVWTARIPEGIDRELAHRLSREVVEDYYENHWIHQPRQGLDGLTPLAASENARRGDAVALAKLEAVVLIREQLGGRASALAMYQGYPFDRLRRRLGLRPAHPENVDPEDLSCAGLAELQDLVAEDLDDVRLALVLQSVAGFRDDALTARFAVPLAERKPAGFEHTNLEQVYAPLVRQAMRRDDPSTALDWLDEASGLGSEALRRTFATWRAEIYSRTARPEEAAKVYRTLVDSSCGGPQAALDAAETLLDNGHHEHAREFLGRALDLARDRKVLWIENLAHHYLKTCVRNGA